MYTTVNFCDFRQAFFSWNRAENFSYDGQKALFDYLEQYEEETGTKLELDVIALCCDFAEEPIEQALANYNCESLEQFEDETQVIWNDGKSVLYRIY